MSRPGGSGIAVRVLGPLELVSPAGTTASVRGSLRLALLARLVIACNQVVATDRLMDDLWLGRPPSSAATALRVHVSHVRRILDATLGSTGATVLVHRQGGYALELEPQQVDARRFEDATAAARVEALTGDGEAAVRMVDQALGQWRGRAYADVDGWPFVAAEAARLEELRLLALEERATWRLARGEHVELLPELAQLVDAHPLRERLWGLRMLALYRCGRQAEALRAYQEARRHLIDHVGVEPSPELRGLERSILEHEPKLLWAHERDGRAWGLIGSGTPPASPLPAAISRHAAQPFAGRKAEVARLIEELAHCGGGSVCFVVLEGEPGIGKTRLAVELAQRAAGSGAVTLYGRCDEEPTCSYQPFVEALHAYVAACPPEVLRSDLAGAGPEVLRLVPQLHQADEAPPVEVVGDPDGDRYRLFASFAALVSTVAARTPVVLIVDDLHWADRPRS